MKKFIAIILTLVIAAGSVMVSFAADSTLDTDTLLLGDVDFDGRVSILDATTIQTHIASLHEMSELSMLAADTNGDGTVTILDATAIQLFLASLPHSGNTGNEIPLPTEPPTEPPTKPTEEITEPPTETTPPTEPPTEVETQTYTYEYHLVTEHEIDTIEFEINFDSDKYAVKKFKLNYSALPNISTKSIKIDSNCFKLPTQYNADGFPNLTLSGTKLLSIEFTGPINLDTSNVPTMTTVNISSEESRKTKEKISYKYIERFGDIIKEEYVGTPFETTAPTFNNPNVSQYSPDKMALEIFEIVNKEREKAGVEPLEFGYFYYDLAKVRAEECTKYFSHDRPDGRKWSSVFDDFGVNTKYRWCGENLAANFTSAEATMVGFMNSPGHRENILRPEFEYVAIAVCENPDYPGYYYTAQLFYSNPEMFD